MSGEGVDLSALEVGYDIPAAPGMREAEIQTPCLIIDLAAFERNVARMKDLCEAMGVRLRAHGKMHKSVDVARYQMAHGGAIGLCCQKVSEAEAFVRGGIDDVLISNQVCEPAKIERLARLARGPAKVAVCVDDHDNVAALSRAMAAAGGTLDCLVEIECGAGRCGVLPGAPVLALARAIDKAAGLRFAGLQAYNGSMQHIRDYGTRKRTAHDVIAMVRDQVAALEAAGLTCDSVTGAGTGTFAFEGASGVYNEVQCGSYAFMDADYQRVRDADGNPLTTFENALFILTSVMSCAKDGQAVCDAGHKVQSVDSGLPVVFGRDDVTYTKCSDEHGVIADPASALTINTKLRLIPGHCDPTCNVHDWYVGVRDGAVEALWPVSARGKAF
ncbi:MAG: DSD1 family PLP-dependent enzyme [Pseudomonadota bacterium]